MGRGEGPSGHEGLNRLTDGFHGVGVSGLSLDLFFL